MSHPARAKCNTLDFLSHVVGSMEEAAGQILGTARKKGVQLGGTEQLPDYLRPN